MDDSRKGNPLAGIFLDGSGASALMSGLILAGSGIGGLGAARTAIGYWAKRQRLQVRRLTDFLHDAISHPESLERGDPLLLDPAYGPEERAHQGRVRLRPPARVRPGDDTDSATLDESPIDPPPSTTTRP